MVESMQADPLVLSKKKKKIKDYPFRKKGQKIIRHTTNRNKKLT